MKTFSNTHLVLACVRFVMSHSLSVGGLERAVKPPVEYRSLFL